MVKGDKREIVGQSAGHGGPQLRDQSGLDVAERLAAAGLEMRNQGGERQDRPLRIRRLGQGVAIGKQRRAGREGQEERFVFGIAGDPPAAGR